MGSVGAVMVDQSRRDPTRRAAKERVAAIVASVVEPAAGAGMSFDCILSTRSRNMLLSIDPDKVREQLATPMTYTVTSTNLETQPPAYYEPVSARAYSTTPAMPVDMERGRERLLLLRQRLIERGVKTLSGEELDRSAFDKALASRNLAEMQRHRAWLL